MEFQFLIGTLKTFINLESCLFERLVSIPHRYSKNAELKTRYIKSKEFQFLIGTLKTLIFFYQRAALSEVSIPHRYSKNSKTAKKNILHSMVSIPHRYSKNRGWSFNS